MIRRHSFQARHEFRFGVRELVIVGCAFVLIWVLTFIFGMLVGREFASPSGAGGKVAAAGAPAQSERPEQPARADRLRAEERLTFYRTLTAPTADLPAVGQPAIEEHLVPREGPAKPAPKTGRRTAAAAPPAEPRGAAQGQAAAAAPPAGTAGGQAEPLWTVQVSSFRSRALADDLRKRLTARGHDAYVVSVSTEEGRVRHRVRVGGFPTRAEAERVATDLRAERHPNVFVTIRTR